MEKLREINPHEMAFFIVLMASGDLVRAWSMALTVWSALGHPRFWTEVADAIAKDSKALPLDSRTYLRGSRYRTQEKSAQ